jgi:hypothetical protein
MNVTCNQTWRNPDGTEYELELILKDGNMQEGEVISCSVSGPGNLGGGFGGFVACSGTGIPATFRMLKTPDNVPDNAPTLEDVEGKDDVVKGMDYDFTATGIMNKDKKLK